VDTAQTFQAHRATCTIQLQTTRRPLWENQVRTIRLALIDKHFDGARINKDVQFQPFTMSL
jgi:hypothetical protein